MLPDIFNLQLIKISLYGLFIVTGFVIWSFIFWRNLRDQGIDDEKIFDNLLTVTISSIIIARLVYVFINWHNFAPNILRVLVIWKFPGFSFWGAFFGGILGSLLITLKQKFPVAQVFDSYGVSFPYAMFWTSMVSVFNGTVIGTTTSLFWGAQSLGLVGKRHPVAIYSAFIALFIIIFIFIIKKKWSLKHKPGIISSLVFFIFGFGEFMLAFFRADLLYWDSVSIEHILAFLVLIVSAVILIINLSRIKSTNTDIKINNL